MLRYLSVGVILALYFALCFWCWFRHKRQHHREFQHDSLNTGNTWLVAYASQTGQAERIAAQTAQQLKQANIAVNLLPLNQVSPADLPRYRNFLCIASTYGEGEAPDNGSSFVRRLDGVDLSGVNYAVLALGDSEYTHYCAFGHQINHLLHAGGATQSFDLIEVDKCEGSALRHWQYHLGQLSGYTQFSDWDKPGYEYWQLTERRCLNPGSAGLPVYLLRLIPTEASDLSAQWVAGDIAEIGPLNDPELPHREYSIASTPAQGTLDLLVRQVRKASGELGLGSGWLTLNACIGSNIFLRVRRNTQFHPPADPVPMILIGNGTGIAGLRAHLHARIQQGAHQNWLFFGERNEAYDFYFREELHAWQNSGAVQRLDVVFSRDQNHATAARYVQDLLPPAAAELHAWIERGAVIYVCGSLRGMAQGVDDALQNILGRQQLEAMAESRRYCRDVY